MNPTVTLAPTEVGIDLEELKTQLSITGSTDDARLMRVAAAALTFTERYLNRTLLTRTYLYTLNSFTCVLRGELDDFWYEPTAMNSRITPYITLPYPPLRAVASVKYYDDAGVLQTISPGNYQVDARREPGVILPVYGYSWPSPKTMLNAVEIEYTAGYGDLFSTLPDDLRHGVMMLIGHLNENRETTTPLSLADVPFGFDDLVAGYKTGSF